jgi:sec-independent protein translocase protein TatC
MFVIAAVATPPDVVSQLMLAIPLMLLFEGSLLIMYFTEQSDAKAKAAAAAAEAADATAQIEQGS